MHDEELPLSKSQRKRDMHNLQDLGEAVVELGTDQIKQLNLPEKLHDAILECKKLKSFGAIRRQLQYIGKLMRHADPSPIRTYLDRLAGISDEHTGWLHQLERRRERLITDDAALPALLEEHPEADPQQLRTLVRNARKERVEGKPPKNFRALFQTLKTLMPEPALPTSKPSDSEHDT